MEFSIHNSRGIFFSIHLCWLLNGSLDAPKDIETEMCVNDLIQGNIGASKKLV
jgi:hypothetical protein